MKLLVSIVALALASGAAFADGGHKTPLREFSYRLKVPAVAGQTCAQNAEGVAQRFAMATKKVAQEVNGQCQTELKDPAALDVVVVNYHAETEYRDRRHFNLRFNSGAF